MKTGKPTTQSHHHPTQTPQRPTLRPLPWKALLPLLRFLLTRPTRLSPAPVRSPPRHLHPPNRVTSRADRLWLFLPTRGFLLLTAPLAPDPVILDIGQTDEEVPHRSLWSRPRLQPLSAPFPPSPRLYAASLLRCWSTVFVPAGCLRTVPCPLWEFSGPSRRTQHLSGTWFIRCMRISFHARLCHRNCATPPAEWPYFPYPSAFLANAVCGRSRLRRPASSITLLGA